MLVVMMQEVKTAPFAPDSNRLQLCAFVSFVLIALMIFVGLAVPVRKAMRVSPTEALHDE